LQDLKKGPVLAPGLQHIAWEDLKFETPSGKIELWSEEAKRVWNISELPEYVEIPDESENGKYPILILTPNAGNRIHSQFGNLKVIKDTTPEPAVLISTFDALNRSILTGNKIRLFNRNGEIFSTAQVSERIPSGTAVLPNGIWLNEGGGANFLIAGRETDIGFGAAFHDNMVEIEIVT
jgi:anaerobic selenocysteine-containing dehydrogenase